MNYGQIKDMWRNAYRCHDYMQDFNTIAAKMNGMSEEYPIPNPGTDIIGIRMQGSITHTSSAAEAKIAGSYVTHFMDNVIILDSNGKTVMNISPESLYNYIADMLDEVQDVGTPTDHAGADAHTDTFDIIVPIKIPATEGIHKLKIDWKSTNVFAADIATVTGTVVLSIIAASQQSLPKFKVTDQVFTLVAGTFNIPGLEQDRTYYAVGIFHLAAVASIDDFSMANNGYDMVKSKWSSICANFRNQVRYTPKAVGDAIVAHREYFRKATDQIQIQGTAAESPTFLLIAAADAAVRPVTQAEISSPIQVVSPQAASGGSAIVSPSVSGQVRTLPVIPNVPLAF